MDLKKRFILFGSGFALGLLLLFFFLNGKDASCNFLPNARMLEILRSKPRILSPEVNQLIIERQIDSTELIELLLKGQIDFSKSKVRQEPCRYYWIDGYIAQQEANIYVENCDSLVTIQKLNFTN